MPDTPPIRTAIGLPPDETVRAFRRRDKLRTTVRWSEMLHEEHARAFTVAKVAQVDLLATIRASLDKVLVEGGTLEQWKAAIIPDLQRAGWWGRVEDKAITGTEKPVLIGDRRLRTIYDTNLRMSRAAGQWKRIQALKGSRPYLMYVAVGDRRTRPLHRRWGGLDPMMPIRIILPVDHPCWSIYYPPNDWGCRCTVRQLSKRDLDRNGWRVTTDTELRRQGWLTPNGEPGGAPRNFYPAGKKKPIAVPGGIGPGFGYNPGAGTGSNDAAAAAGTAAPSPKDGVVGKGSSAPAATAPPAASSATDAGSPGTPTSAAPPAGVAAGFAANPASAGIGLLAEKTATSLATLARTDPIAADNALRAILTPEAAQELARQPWAAFPALILDEALRAAAGFDQVVAMFTAEVFLRMRGQGIDPADLLPLVPTLPRGGEIVALDEGRLLLAGRREGDWVVASVRGPAPQLTHVQALSPRALNKRLAGRKIIRDRDVQPLAEALPDLLAAKPGKPVVRSVGRAGHESAPEWSGFARTIDSQEVRHAIKRHGADPLPVTAETVAMIPTIIADGRRIDQIAAGRREQVFVLERDGRFYVYVERVGTKQARLSFRTMFVTKVLSPRLMAALLAVIAQEASAEEEDDQPDAEPPVDDADEGEGEVR